MIVGTNSRAFNPLSLFSGVTNGGLYIASSPGNTLSQWNDISGLGNHLTQGTALNRYDAITPCYRNLVAYKEYHSTALAYFNLPSITVDRRSHGFWCISRLRSNRKGSDNTIAAFGSGLTDCFAGWAWDTGDGAGLRTWGTSNVHSTTVFGNSSVSLFLISAAAGGITAVSDFQTDTLAAYTSGTLTGGRLFCRNDPGYPVDGEIYEFGLIDRAFTAGEITALQSRYRSIYNPNTKIGQVVVIGDSLTESQNAQSVLSWSSAIDDVIGGSYTMRNMGTGATYASTTWSPAQYNGPASMYNGSLSKNIFICWLGTNDITSGYTAAQIQTAIRAITDPARAAGFKVVGCTITPRGDALWTGTPGFETVRTTLNTNLKADTNFDAVVDLASVSQLTNPANGTYYHSDQLHFIDAGLQVIADTIRPVILSL